MGPKNQRRDDIAAAGNPFISPSLSTFLLQRHVRGNIPAIENPGLEKLTPGERRITKLIAEDFTSKVCLPNRCCSHETRPPWRPALRIGLGQSPRPERPG